MICPQAVESGAYLLGALPPAERAAYQRHLAECRYCRGQVVELAAIPGLLTRVGATATSSTGRQPTRPGRPTARAKPARGHTRLYAATAGSSPPRRCSASPCSPPSSYP